MTPAEKAAAFDEFERRMSVIETRPSLWARAIRYGHRMAAILNLAVKGFFKVNAVPTNKGKS